MPNIFTNLFKKVTSSKRVSLPDYVKRVGKSGEFSTEDKLNTNKDLLQYRYGQSTFDVVKEFAKVSPDLSAALFSYLRLAISGRYTLVSRNFDGTVNVEATQWAQQVSKAFDCTDDTAGFNGGFSTIRSLSESLAKDLVRYGAVCGEIVLDAGRNPLKIVPISVPTLRFKYKGNQVSLWQKVGSDEINIDYPTVLYVALDQDSGLVGSESMFESAIQPIIQAQDYTNDLRKVTKRAFFPKVLVELDTEKWKKTLPPEVLYDEEKLKEAMDSTIAEVSATINGTNPEDSFVFFDMAKPAYLDHGNSSVSDEFKSLNNIINGKASAGMKTSGVVLGHENTASTNIASTQSMLQLKNAEGVQNKLNEFFSRAFTQILRLYGFDVYCDFAYDKPELRPSTELESFKTMHQNRIMTQLSLGYISDEEASIALTGTLPETGAPKLSGTMFFSNGKVESNPYSNNSGVGRPADQALNDTVSAG